MAKKKEEVQVTQEASESVNFYQAIAQLSWVEYFVKRNLYTEDQLIDRINLTLPFVKDGKTKVK
jgi:type IV secretory pathway component VirB8